MRAGLSARRPPPAFTLTYTGVAAAALAARSVAARTAAGLHRAPALVLRRVEWETRPYTREILRPGSARAPPRRRGRARARVVVASSEMGTEAAPIASPSRAIDPSLRIGGARLAVSDVGRSADFYARALGLPLIAR